MVRSGPHTITQLSSNLTLCELPDIFLFGGLLFVWALEFNLGIQIALGPNANMGGPTGIATKASLDKQKTLIESWEERRKVRDGLDGWDVIWCSNSINVNGGVY